MRASSLHCSSGFVVLLIILFRHLLTLLPWQLLSGLLLAGLARRIQRLSAGFIADRRQNLNFLYGLALLEPHPSASSFFCCAEEQGPSGQGKAAVGNSSGRREALSRPVQILSRCHQ